MKKAALLLVVALTAGCASQIMQSYVGKDITEPAMDCGPPCCNDGSARRPPRVHVADALGDGRPADHNATYNAYGSGNWVTGAATTTGGGISSWSCNYTLIGQKNPQGSYTVVDFRRPSLSCE